jgi:hypothetical protein
MKRIITATALAAALALSLSPAIASAATKCSPGSKFELPLHESGTSCRVARDVDRWFGGHEWWDAAPRIDGRVWRGTLYSRAHDHTYFRFTTHTHGTANVWVTNRYPVS